MQISRVHSPLASPGAVGADFHAAAVATLAQPAESANLPVQIAAYQALSRRWRAADDGERAALTPALTESPFARRAQAAINAFTRAAWAGPDAAPPVPQVQALKAFDGLSGPDQAIVAAMHVDREGRPLFASAADFRASLVTDFLSAQPPAAAPRDTVQLSDEAKARLAVGASEAWTGAPGPSQAAADPDLAKAISAYGSGA